MEGHIKKIVRDKGFGFIKDLGGKEYFFHRTAMLPSKGEFDFASEGDRVEFEMERGDRGMRAVRIKLMP